jgi:hypothetical protein
VGKTCIISETTRARSNLLENKNSTFWVLDQFLALLYLGNVKINSKSVPIKNTENLKWNIKKIIP